MKTTRLIFLCMLMYEGCLAQDLSNATGENIPLTVGLLKNRVVVNKINTTTRGSGTTLPLIPKVKNQEENLITQLMHWDWKIKLRLNNRFNFIVTYN